MKNFIYILTAVMVSVFSHTAAAQADRTIDIDGIEARLPDIKNPDDQKLLQQRAKECVRLMNTYITSMTMKTRRNDEGKMRPTLQDRKDCRDAALELFLENGDSIMLTGGVRCSPVLMETTSVNSSGRVIATTRPVKVYFNRLIDMITQGKYTDVSITSSDIESMYVTDIRPDGNRFQCVVTYTQNFIGKRGEIMAYADQTTKRIVVWFEFYDSPWGKEIVPRLGDISCEETKRL